MAQDQGLGVLLLTSLQLGLLQALRLQGLPHQHGLPAGGGQAWLAPGTPEPSAPQEGFRD